MVTDSRGRRVDPDTLADGEDLTPKTSFTPLIAWTTTTPAPALGAGGKVHLAYGLLLRKTVSPPYAIDPLYIAAAETGDTLLTIGLDVVQSSIMRTERYRL
ncbi:hypothetical protein NVV95_03000 [Herbiconiux sp. CPCC 205716]|uniref:Uncharacterized protein n=1 Tax=Herbiconiux gentiana TaxID=2970912 RepID=A0ABT2GBE3_9MICO|nr:hypothetical protein [Herbiconiux gentiana]MCS5713518.1 hypothetical protein [Herbiconiux gentiana]